MTTERPRIQAYLDEELYERFKKWKREHGIKKDSEALNGLLAEYFGVSQFPIPNPQFSMTEEIQEYIEKRGEEWATRIKAELAEKLPSRSEIGDRVTEEINSRFEQHEFLYKKLCDPLYIAEQKLDALRDRVGEQVSQLLDRLDTEENVVKPIEGLAEISYAFAESLLPEDMRSPGQLSQSEAPGFEEEDLAKDSLVDKPLPGELGNNALARRLGVNGSTVLKNRDKPTFEKWTRGKDPDAIAWKYDARLKLFIPLGAS